MRNTLAKIVRFIESSHITFSGWLATFFTLIVTRLLTEHWLNGFGHQSSGEIFIEFSHTFLFFLFAFQIFTWLFVEYLKVPLKVAVSVLMWGFLVIILPPIIDYLVSGGQGYWSFYKFDGIIGLWHRYLTFFGDHPDIGITYGVRVEVALATLGCAAYALAITKKKSKAMLFGLIVYTTFFVLGTLPSWFTILTQGPLQGFLEIGPANVAQDFITPFRLFSYASRDLVSSLGIRMSIILSFLVSLLAILACLRFARKETLSFLLNIRPPQIIYHGGLFFLGIGFAAVFAKVPLPVDKFSILSVLLLGLSVVLAWIASVVFNDMYDRNIDSVTNGHRPLIRQTIDISRYWSIGAVLFIASLFFSAIVFPAGALFLLAYQAVAWMYSAPPLRLKRLPIVASLASAIASLLVLLLGYFFAAGNNPTAKIPTNILVFLAIAYTIALPLKDFKDIEGDKKDGVWTIPVLLGDFRARVVVAVGIFFCFISSVWILHEPRLWLWALTFGILASWAILTNASIGTFSMKTRDLPWALLLCIALYGIVIVRIVFS